MSQFKDPKKIITICHYVLNKNDSIDVFFDELDKSLSPVKEIYEKMPIYEELIKLNGLFITTNIDTVFDNLFLQQRIAKEKHDFDPLDIDKTKLYHIHGSISEPTSIVITVEQYFDRYHDQKFRAFLDTIFAEYDILFIGYGMNEFEILDFVTNRYSKTGHNPRNRFILLPYFSGEERILEFEESYFNQMDISVIAYRKDDLGFGQLFEIIKQWNRRILQTSSVLYDDFEVLAEAANNYAPTEEGKILQLIKNDKILESEFFKQLSKSKDPNPWLIPLKNKGYFNPENNPAIEEGKNSYWFVMGFLENVATINSRNPSQEITEQIIGIIDQIIDYKNGKDERTANILTDRHIVKIAFLLPLASINDKYFNFIQTCIRSRYDNILISNEIKEHIVPRLIKERNRELLLKLLDKILDFKRSETAGFEDYFSLIDSYQLGQILEIYSDQFVEICGPDAIDVAIGKINQIVSENPSQFNYIWIRSIDKKGERDRYDSKLVLFVWDGLKLLTQSQIKGEAQDLLQKDHPIFNRIGLTLICYHYSELKDLFWAWDGNPLENMYLKYEIHQIFKHHSKEFTPDECSTIIRWIEEKSYNLDYLKDPKDREEVLACEKKGWLSSLLDSNNPEIIATYSKYNDIYPAELKHPERDFYFERLSGTRSPISKSELLLKTNPEIVKFLNDFEEEGFGRSKVSSHALCDVFENSIVEDPGKFVLDLATFAELKRPYQYALFHGLSDAWRKGKDFEWSNIFILIKKILDSNDFWTEKYEEGRSNYRNWIVAEIASLIEEGTRNDSHIFDLSLAPVAEETLILLLQRDQSNLFDMGDLVTSVLNSDKGKIFSSMITYSLLVARRYRKDEKPRWTGSIKQIFNDRLDPNFQPSLEFWVTLGKYLPNLCYLDKEWVVSNIDRIFPKEDEDLWIAGFSSYLFYSKVYSKLYELLKKHGHYSKALTIAFKDRHINEHLIQHICIGYFQGFENLEDPTSLIYKIFELWNPNQIQELIRYCWCIAKDLSLEERAKVLILWKRLFSILIKNPTLPENEEIFSELSYWIIYISEIDEESVEWLKLSAKYLKLHEFHFIDSLIILTEKTPCYTGDIFLSMIEAGIFFPYNQDKIIQFVTHLYEKGEQEKADSICNQYLAAGYDFLKETYVIHLKK